MPSSWARRRTCLPWRDGHQKPRRSDGQLGTPRYLRLGWYRSCRTPFIRCPHPPPTLDVQFGGRAPRTPPRLPANLAFASRGIQVIQNYREVLGDPQPLLEPLGHPHPMPVRARHHVAVFCDGEGHALHPIGTPGTRADANGTRGLYNVVIYTPSLVPLPGHPASRKKSNLSRVSRSVSRFVSRS